MTTAVWVSDSSRPAVFKKAASSHMWLLKFKWNLMKLKIQFLSCTSHISSAQKPPVTGGCCVAQCRCRTFLSQKVLLSTASWDCSLPGTRDCRGSSLPHLTRNLMHMESENLGKLLKWFISKLWPIREAGGQERKEMKEKEPEKGFQKGCVRVGQKKKWLRDSSFLRLPWHKVWSKFPISGVPKSMCPLGSCEGGTTLRFPMSSSERPWACWPWGHRYHHPAHPAGWSPRRFRNCPVV